MTADAPTKKITPRANYPLARRAGDFIVLSGATARRPDNTIAGAESDEFHRQSADYMQAWQAGRANGLVSRAGR